MKKDRSEFQRKIDWFCRTIFLTDEGRPKSAFLLYSFCLSLAFIAVYMVSYLFLLEGIETVFLSAPISVKQIAEYFIPALAGTIPCVALSFLFKDQKNMIVASYVWVSLFAILTFVAALIVCDKEDFGTEFHLFFNIIGLPFIICSVLGYFSAKFVYKLRNRGDNVTNRSGDIGLY